jgi:hypothetical protein
MNKRKIAIKFFVILILSLTLTGGYAQALPNLYDFGFQSHSTPSVSDIFSSAVSRIFGNSYNWDASKPDPSVHKGIISDDEAIAIAKTHFHWPAFTKPVTAQLVGMVYKVTVHEYHGIEYRCPDGKSCPPQPSGYIIRINARSGEIISIDTYV